MFVRLRVICGISSEIGARIGFLSNEVRHTILSNTKTSQYMRYDERYNRWSLLCFDEWIFMDHLVPAPAGCRSCDPLTEPQPKHSEKRL